MMLLFGVHYRSLAASLIAFATIVALGIEPSAQQILSFPHSEFSNATAEIGVAVRYNYKFDRLGMIVFASYQLVYVTGLTDDGKARSYLWKASSHPLSGLIGTVLQPSFKCPSTATGCS